MPNDIKVDFSKLESSYQKIIISYPNKDSKTEEVEGYLEGYDPKRKLIFYSIFEVPNLQIAPEDHVRLSDEEMKKYIDSLKKEIKIEDLKPGMKVQIKSSQDIFYETDRIDGLFYKKDGSETLFCIGMYGFCEEILTVRETSNLSKDNPLVFFKETFYIFEPWMIESIIKTE